MSISSYGDGIGVFQGISSYGAGDSYLKVSQAKLRGWNWSTSRLELEYLKVPQATEVEFDFLKVSQATRLGFEYLVVSQATGLKFEFRKVSQATGLEL